MVVTIELENMGSSSSRVFAPGDTIEGKVVIDKHIWNKVEGLTLRFSGKLETGFKSDAPSLPHTPSSSEQSSSLAPTLATTSAPIFEQGCISTARKFMLKNTGTEEVLLDYTINLLDSWRVLKPGRHEFAFTFLLPVRLLPSLKIQGARIHYEFITSVKRPRDDYKIYQTPFYIISAPEEFSDEDFEEFCHPVQCTSEIRISQLFGCCMNGEVSLSTNLETRICPIGGILKFVVNVRNNLRSNLDAVKANLIRKFKYKKNPSWSTKEIVDSVTGPILERGESTIWNGHIRIPHTETATNTTYNDFYEITHILQVSVRSSKHRSKDATIKFSLVLLPSSVASLFAAANSSLEVKNDDGLPPPTYDEAATEDQRSTRHLIPS